MIPRADAGPSVSKREIIQQLRAYKPLIGLLDAARDARVLQLLKQSDALYQSLYEGEKGVELAAFAPYLVDSTSTAHLLPTMVDEGWGGNWGVYLSSRDPFPILRHHLRHFLMVKQPDGQQVYFRFYDPRVLRAFIPGLNKDEREIFFGPIDCFLLESDDASKLLVFNKKA